MTLLHPDETSIRLQAAQLSLGGPSKTAEEWYTFLTSVDPNPAPPALRIVPPSREEEIREQFAPASRISGPAHDTATGANDPEASPVSDAGLLLSKDQGVDLARAFLQAIRVYRTGNDGTVAVRFRYDGTARLDDTDFERMDPVEREVIALLVNASHQADAFYPDSRVG